MLERATAYLKPGAFRDSLRCARGVRRSQRSLHSTFWNHGAGELDLPPWALSTTYPPPDLSLKHDSTSFTPGANVRENGNSPRTERDGLFLDFLYPPQALAWLQRKQGQQARRWEKRNMQRLPAGYIVASKRYASGAYRPFAGEDDPAKGGDERGRQDQRGRPAVKDKPAHWSRLSKFRPLPSEGRTQRPSAADSPLDREDPATGIGGANLDDLGSDYQEWSSATRRPSVDELGSTTQWTYKRAKIDDSADQGFTESLGDILDGASISPSHITSESGYREAYDRLETSPSLQTSFGNSPADLADGRIDHVALLRNILMSSREGGESLDSDRNQALTSRALSIYESLDAGARGDVRLKRELLEWLAVQDNELASMRCMELYTSIPRSSRTIEVYKAALTLILRRGDDQNALHLHGEALERLENGYLISRILFKHAVDHKQWQLAMSAAVQHNRVYTEQDQPNQVRVFWLHVSELPQLLERATYLAQHLGYIEGLRSADTLKREFCLRFFKAAISQEFMQPDEKPRSFVNHREHPRREGIRSMFRHIIDMDKNATAFLEEVMMVVFRQDALVDYPKYHQVFSYVYKQYCELPGMIPSEQLLLAFLRRTAGISTRLRREYDSLNTITTEQLIEDWERYHGKLSREAVNLLLSQYARYGQVERFEKMLDYQRSAYPAYEDRKEALFNMIYIHARRADLDMAQQAFAEVQRIMSENGESPNLQCWNVLLHAHTRVDDLEGALTNFHNILHHAKLRPDSYSFSPLFLMLSKRGDVDGLEDLMERYDAMVDDRRTTDMMLSLMVAHFNHDDNAQAAEKVLERAITMRNEGKVLGSLTGCFNALMGFYAVRRNVDATMRIYRWMRKEKARLDGETFGALMQALLHCRQVGAAFTIFRKVMPEHHIEPTAYHYALLMAGMNKQSMYQEVLDLHRKMTVRNVKPTLGTNVNFLKARAALEQRELANEPRTDEEGEPLALEETLKELQQLVSNHDAADIASGQTMSITDKLDLQDSLAPYFDFLIYIHGKRGCFEAAKKLFEQYKDLSQTVQGGGTISIRMLSALMSVHWRAGEYEKVEEYWKLARQQADGLARPIHVPQFASHAMEEHEEVIDPLELAPSNNHVAETSAPLLATATEAANITQPVVETKETLLTEKQAYRPKPALARRHILDRPLQWYIQSLNSQARIYDAIKVVSQLLSQGYIMGKRTWNLFICCLLDTRPPLALLAFTLAERFLIPQFPGWEQNTKRPARPVSQYHKLERIQARYIGRDQIMPEYNTLVRLAAAMLDIRRTESAGRSNDDSELPRDLQRFVGTVREIRSRAAKTVYAVQSMPAVKDRVQKEYLGPARR